MSQAHEPSASDDTTPADAREVLDFWFGSSLQPRVQWFRKDAAFDAEIGRRFGATIERALSAALAGWQRAPLAALAGVVVLDQFTRNAFRDSARAFAGDALALAAASEMVERGWDLQLAPLQRWFVYLPFEHAENLAAQQESLRLFEALAQDSPALQDALVWARKHFDVIQRFGRYPHRNALLGRVSTPEEEAFLQQPGSSF